MCLSRMRPRPWSQITLDPLTQKLESTTTNNLETIFLRFENDGGKGQNSETPPEILSTAVALVVKGLQGEKKKFE